MDGLTEDEIAAKLEDLVKANDKIRRENELYESYVSRNVTEEETKTSDGRRDRKKRRGADKRTRTCLTF